MLRYRAGYVSPVRWEPGSLSANRHSGVHDRRTISLARERRWRRRTVPRNKLRKGNINADRRDRRDRIRPARTRAGDRRVNVRSESATGVDHGEFRRESSGGPGSIGYDDDNDQEFREAIEIVDEE